MKTRLGGAALRRGVTGNTDVKLAYSYLWNSNGPNAQLGPNVGVKWRFARDWLRKPSLAISALCVMNQKSNGRSHKSDYGATLIGSCSAGFAYVLVNYGHVWVGDNVPDLRYVGFALVRPVSKRMLAALEYADVERLGSGGPPVPKRQIAAGLVYGYGSRCIYSIEVGYLPDGVRIKWHTTLGGSDVFLRIGCWLSPIPTRKSRTRSPPPPPPQHHPKPAQAREKGEEGGGFRDRSQRELERITRKPI